MSSEQPRCPYCGGESHFGMSYRPPEEGGGFVWTVRPCPLLKRSIEHFGESGTIERFPGGAIFSSTVRSP